MTVSGALKKSTEKLKALGLERPQIEAQLLMAKVLKIDRSQILAVDDRILSAIEIKDFENLVARRMGYEPMAYIRGEKEFFGLRFEVSPAVLIPRPETEGLVEGVLDCVKKSHRVDGLIVDLGTGSGAIAVALSKMLPDSFDLVGVDISNEALKVAERNAAAHGCRNLRFIQSDLFDPSTELLAALKHAVILVSNPPYIPTSDISKLIPDIQQHEPRLALDGGEDGLRYYREILGWYPERLSKIRLIGLETHLPEQRERIEAQASKKAEVSVRGPHLFLDFSVE